MNKRIALFEVKAIGDSADPYGEFEAILSVPVVDRDGEVIDPGAFDPLPAEIPIHKFHDFSSPVATAVPYYDGDVLKAKGVFDPDPDAQMIRAKVGRSIRYMSVGFMAAARADDNGVPHITKAELLEASFVSVPANREAAILAVKAGRTLSTKNEQALRQAAALINGVLEQLAAPDEGSAPDKSPATNPEVKAAAPAAAEQAAAAAAADPPAEVSADHQARLALLRASAHLAALTVAGT